MFPRIRADFSAKALITNYDAIRSQVPGQALLPMIKANAYGHGAAWAARILATEPDLYGFGVATLEEGAEVRKALSGSSRKNLKILVASGTALWSEEKGQYCEKYGLTATVSSEEDWVKFLSGRWNERISYELKFNTGMNRLGIAPSYARVIVKALKNLPSVAHPSGVFTHLAIGESPDEKLSTTQRERFVAIRADFEATCPSVQYHLANSSAIWNEKRWGLDGLTDVVRPGLSLYGVVPFPGAPVRGLVPVMRLQTQVVMTHELKAGERVGYGGTFKAKEPVKIAVMASGYADGLKRGLGGSGTVIMGSELHSFIGIVSMDLSSATCPKGTRAGDWAQVLGPGIDPWDQAKAAGTIPYELLTSVGGRVERIYE